MENNDPSIAIIIAACQFNNIPIITKSNVKIVKEVCDKLLIKTKKLLATAKLINIEIYHINPVYLVLKFLFHNL